MVSLGALIVGGAVALLFVVWTWRFLGAVAGGETLVVGIVVVVGVAALYGLLPPLFGFMTTGAGVVVAGLMSLILLKVLF